MESITEEMGLHKGWYEEARQMTVEKLPEFIRKLTQDYDHDYGTICHAIAAAAVGAAWAVEHSPVGGITGFQASCITWELIRHWGGIEGPARLVQYENMLFPQYGHNFTAISAETWKWLQEQAAKKIAESDHAHPAVIAHWKRIAAGEVPFGLAVEAA